MLREEGMAADAASTAAGGAARPATKFWSMLGGLSGGALGFIIGNVPGLLAGAVAGNRLGAVRDARGKSVYDVFLVGCAPVFLLLVFFSLLLPLRLCWQVGAAGVDGS